MDFTGIDEVDAGCVTVEEPRYGYLSLCQRSH